MNTASAIYKGFVTHHRLRPRDHKFRYRVFSLLLDLDEIDDLAAGSRLFKRNRWAPLSFHDHDHGDRGDLQQWLDRLLAANGIAAAGRRQVLCYPRLFGFVFNPLSTWFCHSSDGSLAAIVYEVHNTFGERHAYVLAVAPGTGAIHQDCAKNFYVSPFLSRDCSYRFTVRAPGDDVLVAIDENEGGVPVLNALFTGRRHVLSDRNLFAALLQHPLMTVKIVVAIHFEALRLWLKRVPVHAHRAEPAG